MWQVLVVFGRAALLPALPLLRRRAPPGPVRMRAALEQLGGAWVKLGQMLALRFDLLPAAYCDELFKLLNEVRPFPYAQVREIVQRELGGPPEAVFRAFAPEPFAAASIGQVHRAVLPGGRAGGGQGAAPPRPAAAADGHRPDVRRGPRAGLDAPLRRDAQP